jgi:hypothetical protein
VQAHLLQELRGLEAAAVHLSGRASNRISSAACNRDCRREMREEERSLFGFVGGEVE